MKIMVLGIILVAALGLGACTAGVSMGSASFSSGPQGDRVCGHSYDASVGVPAGPDNGVHSRKGCVVKPTDDDTD